DQSDTADSNIASSEVSSVVGSVKTSKTSQRVSSSSERQIKFERAQKCLENAALVSKRIKEHRKATAELLGRPFEDDDGGDTASELASTVSERTGYSAATDTSTTMSFLASVQPADSSNVTQLLNTIKEKENSLSVMQVKIRAMETTILDLQEMINEKDQIIEAKNKATTLMSDTLSKKEKDSLILLEDTRQQMTKMQENFIAMETEWKEEKQNLLKEIAIKDEKITSLEEANTILETSRFEISVAHSKLAEELEAKNLEILRLQEKIEGLSQITIDEPSPKEKDDVEEEKGSLEIAGMAELTKKIELLEQLNCQIRQTNKELENKLATVNTEPKSPSTAAAGKKGSPLTTRKGGRNTAAKSKSLGVNYHRKTDKKAAKSEIARLEMLVQSLNKDILEKEYAISEKDALITQLQNVPVEKEQKKTVEMVDVGLCTDIPEDNRLSTQGEIEKQDSSVELKSSNEEPSVSELVEKLKAAEEQIVTLNNEIDAANKNMIKVKSNNKLKLKQLQKTIDNFSKVSDTNAEIIKLNEEIHQLSQKVAELEEEKGNLQLHLVDYDSGRLTDSDIYKKMVEMENLAETRLKAISVLETQKFDLVQELHILQQKNDEMEDKLADISQLQSEHVCTEMKSVQMEEQIDELTAAKKELEIVIENLKLDKEHLNDTIKHLQEEKEEVTHKLENYIQENMELTDKLEKLSAEKVSSAESIEIVESLTTQEKLELEEYNKGIVEDKCDDRHEDNVESQNDKNIDSLIEQREELNTKIELFTQERQEVMEKMTKIGSENESLLEKISELNNQCSVLQSNIDILNNEKQELQGLNQELSHQIEELKRERIEIMKETAETAKPVTEDLTDGVPIEAHHDDKSAGDKGTKGAKSVKQLTKEILKLKNVIKEREDEIADCQMKILSMEEQQQKQKELLQTNASYESKIKSLIDENAHLKQDLDVIRKETESKEQVMRLKQSNEELHQELQKVHQEYAVTVGYRDAKINELENVLLEYEKQMFNYGNTLQQKDKEMAEYINQITKLNDVSQKLKSTIELLEEEKAKDQNAELVKALNKQIAAYQKKIADNEEKIKTLEDEKVQLQCLKAELGNKNTTLESELKKLKDSFTEKQSLIKELQTQQQKHAAEMSSIKLQIIEKDEEIHEIKLQLRKESIENEKLRDNIADKEKQVDELTRQIEDTKEKLNNLSSEKNNSSEQFVALETKNKELMEKLKKFAISIKKKSSMYTELETLYEESQKQLSNKNEQLEQLTIQVETLPALQEKLKHAEEEMNRLQSQKVTLEQQRTQDINQLQTEIKALQERLIMSSQEITHLNDSVNVLHKDLHFAREENIHFKAQIDALNNKLVEYEIEQKNNSNLITKISSLEADIAQKQNQIAELLIKVEHHEQQQTQVQFGYDAKVQERDLYIENLETEISKYKNRICRLEESISVMEDGRHSLERKADQLGSQLQEKQKAYTEYTSQEDELVGRLAVLMDHDREMQYKVQHLNEDNQKLRKALSEIQEHYSMVLDKANKLEPVESELSKCQAQLRELEANLKKITHDHQSLIAKKRQEIEELESEFNTQIENAIKEKKILSEKYEKVNERTSQLEAKLNLELKNMLQTQQTNSVSISSNMESQIAELNAKLNQSASTIDQLTSEVDNLRGANEQLYMQLTQKEEQIKELKDNQKLTFEMSIPKTEGMIISSTIEPVSAEDKNIDMSALESQIVSEIDEPLIESKHVPKKVSENIQKQPMGDMVVEEPLIVAKKAYDCYTKDDDENTAAEVDPFNSDEGWGLGECDETSEVTPGFSHLKEQINQLQRENSALKAELEMKEKLDNEIELWKFKFKEANDKLSSMQWGGETKDSQPQEQSHTQLKNEISNLHSQLQHHQTVTQNYEVLKGQLDEMQKSNEELVQTNDTLTEKLQNIEKQYNDLTQSYEKLNNSIEEIKTNYEQEKALLVDRHSSLEEELIRLQQLDSESKTQIASLYSELEKYKSKLLFHKEQDGLNRLQSADSLALAEKCSAMEQHCMQLKHELDEANSKILQLESENHELIQKSKEYQDQINDLNTKMQNLNGENDNLLSTVAELRSSVSSAIDQRGFEIAELWKQHLAQREADFQKIESDLRTQLNASEAKYEQLLENVQSSNQEETSKLIAIEQVTSLQSKLEDKEEHVRNLQVKYAEVMNQLDMLRSEMEDEKVGHENKLLEQQEEYEKMIQEMTVKHHKHNESYDETFKNMQNEIISLKTNNDELNQVIEDLQNKLKESENSVIEATNQLRLKESEIYQKTHDYTITLTQRNEEFENVRKQFIEYEKRVEDLSYEKESELALLRLKMHENDTRYENMRSEAVAEKEKLIEELNAKIVECTNLNKQIVDLNQELESQSAKAAEMQAALENQEIEIVGLNDEITNLQNLIKSSSAKVQKHVSFASDTKPGAEGELSENVLNKDLLDAVPRAELDLALYMLHQRDVRCEELTMELTQLLEERDTLQLRLSDCLRLNEDLKNKFKMAGFDESMNSSQETISELPSFTVEREFVDVHRGQTSRSSSISDPDGEKPKLQAKLTELRSVKHSRDVPIPAGKRATSAGPTVTAARRRQPTPGGPRDSQSTSTVLLNWLRGKSTPKVVHM
ncbi:hypothetical protein HW555_011642, partial [Spodoptera exigua]